ncbi:hypothetical protein AB0F72_02130 [Actinoplanes sp. NPDC023936]|uniref:hypothetical protein n=1 Tax=Actinoplanes sp. NPDC023936 TaxID=3154910 RepID=UPI0033F1FC13
MKRPILLAGAAVVIASAALAVVRWTAPAEPRLVLPAVEQFRPGSCRDAAEAVRTLARLTHADDVTTLTAADRTELRRVQERLDTLRPAAPAEVREPMAAVVLSLGYLRLRLDSRTAEPGYLHDVETARAALERTCVSAG